ncbi:MAG: hypothetical protein GX309_02805 [Clostridiales bacterium]|nr:hypothetical protein [Clostridiales bacterium]
MRFFQKAMINSYYWNDEKIKDLHEDVIKRSIGTYRGFFSEYGQAVRINKLDLIKEKEIINDINNEDKLKRHRYIMDFIKDDSSKVVKLTVYFSYLERTLINLYNFRLLDCASIRAG